MSGYYYGAILRHIERHSISHYTKIGAVVMPTRNLSIYCVMTNGAKGVVDIQPYKIPGKTLMDFRITGSPKLPSPSLSGKA